MKTVIYIDLLISEGVVINYILLICTATFTSMPKSRIRLFLAALFGGLASLLILLPSPGLFAEIIIKVIITTLIILIAFRGNRKSYLKCALWYLVCNCLLAGLLLLFYLSGIGSFYSKNMQLYLDISPLLLIATTVIMYVIIKMCCMLFIKPEQKPYQCIITYNDHPIPCLCVHDSGFVATDILHSAPLLLVDFVSIKKQLDKPIAQEITDYFEGGRLSEGLSILPLNGVGGSELLPVLYPVTVTIDNKKVKKAKLCLTKRRIDLKGASCLLSLEFMEVYNNENVVT